MCLDQRKMTKLEQGLTNNLDNRHRRRQHKHQKTNIDGDEKKGSGAAANLCIYIFKCVVIIIKVVVVVLFVHFLTFFLSFLLLRLLHFVTNCINFLVLSYYIVLRQQNSILHYHCVTNLKKVQQTTNIQHVHTFLDIRQQYE